ASGTIGTPFSYTVATDNTPDSITIGTLPDGLTYDLNTKIISGTPTAAGSFTVHMHAANSCHVADVDVVIVITGGGGSCSATTPTISSGNSSTVTAGQQFSYTITTTGSITALTVDNLPSWLHYDSTTGVVFGTAPASGNYSFDIHAVNQCANANSEVAITVV